MYTNKRMQIFTHFKQHSTIYIFMIILFLTGVIFGAVIVNSMGFVQKHDLFFYLEQYFEQIINGQSVASHKILSSSFLYHLKYLALLAILGISVIGLPIVWILLFLKGLVIGFSVGFIVNQLGMKGLILAALSIAPQNFIIIPIYIIAGCLSMTFSLLLIGKLFTRNVASPIFQPLGRYLTIFSILIVVSIIPALLEAYISNHAMQTYINNL